MSESLGEGEMLWKHELTGELMFFCGNMFSISFRKFCEEKRKQLVFFDHQNVNSFVMSTA